MEKSNNRVLNELLVNLFHNVMDAEAKAVITEEFKDITNNDPYDHSGSGRGRNADIDQMSWKTGYIFQRRQRGVTGEIRWLLFCAYDEPACSILRWAHLFDKIL